MAPWLGPDGHGLEIESYDLSSGGRYRYLDTDPEGTVHAFRGSFHTVRPEELIIQTFEWEGMPDVVSIETVRFEELDGGRSRVTGWSVLPSVEARSGG